MPSISMLDGGKRLVSDVVTNKHSHALMVTTNISGVSWSEDGQTYTCKVHLDNPRFDGKCSVTVEVLREWNFSPWI